MMRTMLNWIFDRPGRVTLVGSLAVASIGLLFFSLLGLRAWQVAPTPWPSPTPSADAVATPETTSTDLQPSDPAPNEPSPTADYGSAAPIALEAVNAWLLGDMAAFASLAQPDVVEAAGEAPRPPAGSAIKGSPVTVLDGPTRQQIRVDTTDGPLDLDMIVIDGAWIVDKMVYRR